jgi:hypothetical protein
MFSEKLGWKLSKSILTLSKVKGIHLYPFVVKVRLVAIWTSCEDSSSQIQVAGKSWKLDKKK